MEDENTSVDLFCFSNGMGKKLERAEENTFFVMFEMHPELCVKYRK